MRKKEKAAEEERFETIYSQCDVDVIVDRMTGVNYMVYNAEHVIPLLDSDGKVMVTPVTYRNSKPAPEF